MHLAQVGVASGGEGAAEVQRGGGVVVGGQEPARVRPARLGGEVEAVDGVAAVGGQLHAVARLGDTGAGLGELPRHPADLDDRHARRVREHDRDLQQGPEFGPDVVGGRARERLRAVAALQDERFTPCRRGEPVLELVAFTGEHKRRQPSQFVQCGAEGIAIRPLRLLRGRPGPPAVKITHV